MIVFNWLVVVQESTTAEVMLHNYSEDRLRQNQCLVVTKEAVVIWCCL